MNEKTAIGNRIKEFGIKNFGSLTEFSKKMNMTVQGLYPYTNGKSLPGALLLLRMKKLGCSIDWLLSGEKTKPELKIETIKKILEE